MSVEAATRDLLRIIDRRIAAAKPYRAIVTGIGSGLVSIRKLEAATAGTAAYARIVGFTVAVNDEVLCLDIGKAPVIIGKIQRATSTLYSLDAPLALSTGATINTGAGSPEGVVTAPVGSIYLRTGGAAGTIVYEKATGAGNTGWVATAPALDTGYQTPPGPVVLGTTNVTALASQQCGARYLGRTPFGITSIEVNVQVTTAAGTITWAEVALASANSAAGGNLTLLGSVTNVAATFNSTGTKTVTFSISVPAGTFLYFLFGSQATTPFQLRATLADEVGLGVHRLAATTRPSTMAAPTAFSTSGAITGAAWCPFRWA